MLNFYLSCNSLSLVSFGTQFFGCFQYLLLLSGHPSKYSTSYLLLNFTDVTGSGASFFLSFLFYLPTYLTNYLSIYLSLSFFLNIYLSIYLSHFLSFFLSFFLSQSVFIYLSVYCILSISFVRANTIYWTLSSIQQETILITLLMCKWKREEDTIRKMCICVCVCVI